MPRIAVKGFVSRAVHPCRSVESEAVIVAHRPGIFKWNCSPGRLPLRRSCLPPEGEIEDPLCDSLVGGVIDVAKIQIVLLPRPPLVQGVGEVERHNALLGRAGQGVAKPWVAEFKGCIEPRQSLQLVLGGSSLIMRRSSNAENMGLEKMKESASLAGDVLPGLCYGPGNSRPRRRRGCESGRRDPRHSLAAELSYG